MVSGPPGRRVTVRAIAAQSGVSIATVSRVLTGQTNVAPETRELVQRTVEQLGAQAPAPARANPAPPPTPSTCAARTRSPTTSA